MSSVVAVVGIKTNNVRLPGKNTRPLAGRPLYEHMWSTLKQCARIDRVLVDSSDPDILEAARRWDFDTFERDPSFNGPEVSGHDLIENVMPAIDEDIIGQIFVTTPLIRAETIDKAVALLQATETADCVLPVYQVFDRFWYRDQPVSHDPSTLVGTQYMDPLYREAGFYLFRREAFARERARVTERKTFIEVDPEECADVDTEMDFLYAEALIKGRDGQAD